MDFSFTFIFFGNEATLVVKRFMDSALRLIPLGYYPWAAIYLFFII